MMLEFPQRYFEDEVRDGFYVSSTMKKCWAAQLEVLSDVAKVCKRYGINWFADCGSLLGAVRHGGFVPWDDDLDICMFRDDYYRFLSIASRELCNMWPNYKVLNYHNGGYWEPISRIVNADDINFSKDRLEKFHGYPFSAGIDIFPLDFVCPDPSEEEARKKLFKAIFELADSEYAETVDKGMLEDLAKTVGKEYDNSKSAKLQLYEWGEIVSSLYRREEAKDVCLMTFWYRHNNHKYPMELFDKTVMLPFENIMIQAPAGYNEVLKIEYGDYMKLVRTGGIHEYPHYEVQIDKLAEWVGQSSPFHKSISRESLAGVRRQFGDGNPRIHVKDNSLETINLIQEAHGEITKLLDSHKTDGAIGLLSQCQDTAIQIGTYIEENQGDGFVTVKYLEEYCELIYQLSERIIAGEIITVEIADKQLETIRNSIIKDIKVLKEVVFVPFKADCWSYMEGLWKEYNEDPSVRALVMPIPYYEKKAMGEIAEQYYDINDYPDYVTIIDYNSYDFEKRQPDMIVIQYPYDNDNFVTTVDSKFYSKNLKQYTDELVYIPYFKTEEIGQGEERAYKVMDNYVLSPAVVYADRVMVQSENIKKMYVKKLVEFFGEESRQRWENKIDETGAYLYAENKYVSKDKIDMPEEWRKVIFRPDGSAKKVVIYNTSISGLFEHKKKMIDKMHSVFATFKENRNDIVVIWRPDPLVDTTIPTTDPNLYKAYEDMVCDYKTNSSGIYDDSGDMDRLLMLADAYYGDTDKLVQKCREKMIPVMIQNVDIV